jgi:hypothetical protein
MEELVELYFHSGLTYKQMVSVMLQNNGITISERHLKRLLQAMHLTRRRGYSDIESIVRFIHTEIQSSGALHGYRWMYAKCIENGFKVRKEHVRIILACLDPLGRDFRLCKRITRRAYFAEGPNFIWHADGYDKIKPFGICINGAIDGYSRKIQWLNAYHTNSDPTLIGGYFIQTVEKLGTCPRILRTDKGTENGHMLQFQCFLRRTGTDVFAGDRSALTGKSTLNQRIEYWWGFLRKECIEYWLVIFHDLKNTGQYDGGLVDKNVLQFCFLSTIQVSRSVN